MIDLYIAAIVEKMSIFELFSATKIERNGQKIDMYQNQYLKMERLFDNLVQL